MKRLYIILLLLTGWLSSYSQPGGAEITYKCLDAQGNYEVTLTYYRNCQNTTMCAGVGCASLGSCTKLIEIYGGDPGNTGVRFFTATLNAVSVRDVVFHPQNNLKSVCENQGCAIPGTFKQAFERYDYKGTVNIGPAALIPAAACNIRFVFRECCRNPLTDAFTGSNADFYTDAVVNRCAVTYPNCNSVQFANDPMFVTVSGPANYLNFGAYDPDQDSLVYSLAPSLTDFNTSVVYTLPYSAAFPLPFTPGPNTFPNGFNCSATTGDIWFKPTTSPFIGSISVRIDQYRRINNTPTLVGITRRDYQVNIISALNNNPPTLRTIPAGSPALQPKTLFETCAGSQICFDVIAKDTDFNPPNVSDTTYLTWSHSLEQYGATFTPLYSGRRDSIGPREDTYRFCWTPPDSVANRSNGQDYTFTITGEDNNSPYSGSVTRSFRIRVYQRAALSITKRMLDCNKWTVAYEKDASIVPAQNFSAVRWKVANQPNDFTFASGSVQYNNAQTLPTLTFSKTGKYLIELSADMSNASGVPCTKVYYDTIEVKQALNIRTSNDTTLCRLGLPVTVKVISTDTAINTLRWFSLPDTSTILVTNPQFSLNPNKSAAYLLRAYDNETGCQFSDTTVINVAAIRVKIASDKLQSCQKGNVFTLTNQSQDTANNPLIHRWTFSNGDTSSSALGFNKTFTIAGNYTVKLVESTFFGCKDSAALNLSVFPSPQLAFTVTTDTAQCQNKNSFTVNNQSTVSGESLLYNWDLGNGNTSLAANPPAFSYSTFGLQTIKLTGTTNTHACQDTMSRKVYTFPSPKAVFTVNNPMQCRNGNQFVFTNSSTISAGSLSANWTFGDGGTTSFYSPSYIFNTDGNYSVKLKVSTAVGCIDSATLPVQVLSSPFASFTINDDIQCTNDLFVFTNTTQLTTGTYTSIWDDGKGTGTNTKDFSDQYVTAGNYDIKLKVSSTSGCSDSVTHSITVNDRPEKQDITGDTLATRHTSKTYSVIDKGNTYNWIITGDSAHTVNGSTVLVRWGPSSGGTISLIEINNLGCHSDTSRIRVNVVPKAGLNEAINNEWLSIYPQPAIDQLMLSGKLLPWISHIVLYASDGRLIKSFSKAEVTSAVLNLQEIYNGLYFLHIVGDQGLNQIRRISIMK